MSCIPTLDGGLEGALSSGGSRAKASDRWTVNADMGNTDELGQHSNIFRSVLTWLVSLTNAVRLEKLLIPLSLTVLARCRSVSRRDMQARISMLTELGRMPLLSKYAFSVFCVSQP